MQKVKLLLLFILSRLINGGFKSFINRLIFLTLIGSVCCFIFSNNIKNDVLIVLLFSLILSISIKRVSSNFILSLLTGHLSMNLRYPKEYREYSYKDDKNIISEKLKEEFILGILEASKYRKTLRFSTHGWFIKNVVLDNRIKGKFNINIKRKNKTMIPTEVLSLFSGKEVFRNTDFAFNSAVKKREGYYVLLKKK